MRLKPAPKSGFLAGYIVLLVSEGIAIHFFVYSRMPALALALDAFTLAVIGWLVWSERRRTP